MFKSKYCALSIFLCINIPLTGYCAETNLKNLEYKEPQSHQNSQNPLKDLQLTPQEDKLQKRYSSYGKLEDKRELFPSKRYIPVEQRRYNAPDHVLGIEDSMDKELLQKR